MRAATKVPSATEGNPASQSKRLRAARQPHDMPRKQAIRTIFVKNWRKITLAENQRMQANSRNRIRNPIRKRFTPSRRTLSQSTVRAMDMIAIFLTCAETNILRFLSRRTRYSMNRTSINHRVRRFTFY